MEEAELRLLLEEAAAKGAERALREVGLEDDRALNDVLELRDLIKSWRAVKLTVGQTLIRILIYAVLISMLGNAGWHFLTSLKNLP